jgi:hypothetical protein
LLKLPHPKELTRAEIIRAAGSFRWNKKMPKRRVIVNSRELPARPLVLQAAGVPPNDPTNSHQAVAILENLGFETRYGQGVPTAGEHFNASAPALEKEESIAELFSNISQQVAPTDWNRVRSDLSKNLDH